MGRLLGDRRLLAAAGISLLLHLGVAGLLWVAGPGLFRYDSVSHDTTMTVYALGTGAGTELDADADTDADVRGAEPEADDGRDQRAESGMAEKSTDEKAGETIDRAPDKAPEDSGSRSELVERVGERVELDPEFVPDNHELAEAEEPTGDGAEGGSDADEPVRRENMELDHSAHRTPASTRRDEGTKSGQVMPGDGGGAAGAEPERAGVSRAELLEQLYRELEEAFRYPRIARDRGIEGTVLLSVWVGLDGELKELTVEEASGSRILDEAASETVAQLFPRSRSQQDAHRVRVRVSYALN